MSSRSRGLAAAALVTTTLFGLVPGSAIAEPRPTLAQARAKVAELQHQAEEAGEAANDLTGRMRAAQQRAASINVAVVTQQKHVDQIGRQIGAQAVADFQRSTMTTAGKLLLSEDPEAFIQQASTAQAFAAQQSAVLRRYQGAQGKLTDLRAGHAVELQQLSAATAEQNKLKAQITAKLAEAETVLSKLTTAERARLAAEDAAEVREEQEEARREQQRTSRETDRPGADEPDVDVPASGKAGIAVAFALAQIGDPYLWAAAGPDSFDCSGLTMAAWGKAGVALSHSSKAQFTEGRRVERSALRPGDLLFYYTPISHVSMYIGNGKAIHASRPGKPVKIDPAFGQMPFVGAVRPG
ncbi:NlpC/P60 family protein [Kribbella sp. DT2]|uniref:C40 family peptidase n=1 Tax=Kribbella sp. DT2 TaxID=3393427 RepID=UPI003CFAD103